MPSIHPGKGRPRSYRHPLPAGFDPVAIGQRIEARRLALGLPRKSLAALVGTDCQSIDRFIVGFCAPSAKRLYCLARALRCSSDCLLGLPYREFCPECDRILQPKETHNG